MLVSYGGFGGLRRGCIRVLQGVLGGRWEIDGGLRGILECCGRCWGDVGGLRGYWGAMGSTGGILGEAEACGVSVGGMRCY